MRKLTSLLAGALGLAALAVFVLAVVLLFGGLSRRRATPTMTPPLTTTRPATPTVVPTRITPPPLQTPTQPASPLPTPTVPVPGLGDYVFGPPQVVLTHTSVIGIASWLPDSESLLIARVIPNTPRETIDTFNVRTAELRQYGERISGDIKPIWLDTPHKVAFADLSDKQYDLWISGYGNARARQPVFRNVEYPLAGGGNNVVIVPRHQRQLILVDGAGQARGPLPIDLAAYGFAPDNTLTYFRLAWSPTGVKLAIYDVNRFLVVNIQTGQVQEIDLGDRSEYGRIWAFRARWSPDGRYLALLTIAGDPPAHFLEELTVLDTTAGMLRWIDSGLRHLHDLAWAPNSRYLAVMGDVRYQEGHTFQGLYLVPKFRPN